MIKYFVNILFFGLSLTLTGQIELKENIEILPIFEKDLKPISIGLVDDGYPDSIKIIGIIEAICPPINYSDTCSDRTAIVSLSSSCKKYLTEKVFLILPNVNNNEKFVGKSIQTMVYKYYGELPKFYQNKVHNIFDTEGIPFYYLREKIKI